MAVPRGAFSRPFMHTPPPRDHGDGNVLAVGWRVRVTSPAGRGHRVALTDSEGTTTVTTLPDGTEVEILAWRPRRSGATLYRVQPTSGGKEGWLSGASLKAHARTGAAEGTSDRGGTTAACLQKRPQGRPQGRLQACSEACLQGRLQDHLESHCHQGRRPHQPTQDGPLSLMASARFGPCPHCKTPLSYLEGVSGSSLNPKCPCCQAVVSVVRATFLMADRSRPRVSAPNDPKPTS